jgi:hypothetical protein
MPFFAIRSYITSANEGSEKAATAKASGPYADREAASVAANELRRESSLEPGNATISIVKANDMRGALLLGYARAMTQSGSDEII